MTTNQSDYEQSLHDFWQKLNELPEDLKPIAEAFWDYTGRQQQRIDVALLSILDLCRDFDTFKEKYRTFMGVVMDEHELSEFTPEMDKMILYWNIYAGGMTRIAREIKKAC